MSIRTVVEINHDRLGTLERHPEYLESLPRSLASSFVTAQLNTGGEFEILPGIRVLGQRHHSETLNLEVK